MYRAPRDLWNRGDRIFRGSARKRTPPREGVREVDAFDRAIRLKATVWGVMIGVASILLSFLLAYQVGAEPPVSYLFPGGT